MAKKVDKDDKRSSILDSAIRVSIKKGLVGTTIQDIADEACVSKGTLYLYFKNKKDIIKNILHRDMVYLDEIVKRIELSHDKPVEKLKNLINIYLANILNDKYPPEIILDLWSTILRTNEKKNMEEQVKNFSNVISILLKQISNNKLNNKNIKTLGWGIVCFIHGIIVTSIIVNKKFSARDIIKKFIDILTKGM